VNKRVWTGQQQKKESMSRSQLSPFANLYALIYGGDHIKVRELLESEGPWNNGGFRHISIFHKPIADGHVGIMALLFRHKVGTDAWHEDASTYVDAALDSIIQEYPLINGARFVILDMLVAAGFHRKDDNLSMLYTAAKHSEAAVSALLRSHLYDNPRHRTHIVRYFARFAPASAVVYLNFRNAWRKYRTFTDMLIA